MSGEVRESVFAVVGVAATTLGIGLLVSPSLGTVGSLAWLIGAIEARPDGQILLVLGFAVVGYLAIELRSRPEGETASRRFDRLVERGPEQVTALERAVTAQTLDTEIERAIEEGGTAIELLRGDLRAVTITLVAEFRGISQEQATVVVDDGSWCRDPVATTFLEAKSSSTLWQTLRYVLFPKRERRKRIERTVAAIERLERQ